MPEITHTLTRDDQDVEVTVEFDYHGASRGSRDCYGCPMEPDEPAFVEITSVTDENGNEIELTADETERIEEKCVEEHEGARFSYDED